MNSENKAKEDVPVLLEYTTLEALLATLPDLPALSRGLEEREQWAIVETSFNLPSDIICKRHDLTLSDYRKLVNSYAETVKRIRIVRHKLLETMLLDSLYPAITEIWNRLQSILLDKTPTTARGLRDIASVCRILVDLRKDLATDSGLGYTRGSSSGCIGGSHLVSSDSQRTPTKSTTTKVNRLLRTAQ